VRPVRALLLLLAACQGTVRLYEGEAEAVGWIEVRGDGGLSAPAGAGDVAWEAILVAFDGAPLARPAHRVEVRPGLHALSIRVQRWELPWISRWRDHPELYWEKTGEGVHDVILEVAPGVTYWLDWIPEWREDRPPGPPMVFRERKPRSDG
jgi:hypothetical protein